MSLLRPVTSDISQPFLGEFVAEPAGWVKVRRNLARGFRSFRLRAIKYRHVHLAVDFASPLGTPVQAVHDGKLVAQFVDVDGAVVIIQRLRTGRIFVIHGAYWHLQRNSFRFATGTDVKQGRVIAHSGDTGNTFYGGRRHPHLHFELWRTVRGTPLGWLYRLATRLDPVPFFHGRDLDTVS